MNIKQADYFSDRSQKDLACISRRWRHTRPLSGVADQAICTLMGIVLMQRRK